LLGGAGDQRDDGEVPGAQQGRTPSPNHPQPGDGYPGAVAGFGFVANAVLTADEAVRAMEAAGPALTSE